MPFVYRGGYGLADLLNDFENDFLVFYLRRLHGFDFDCHFVTSIKNIAVFENKDKRGNLPHTFAGRVLGIHLRGFALGVFFKLSQFMQGAQFPDGLFLYLTDALAGNPQVLSGLFKGKGVFSRQAEAELYNFHFPFR